MVIIPLIFLFDRKRIAVFFSGFSGGYSKKNLEIFIVKGSFFLRKEMILGKSILSLRFVIRIPVFFPFS